VVSPSPPPSLPALMHPSAWNKNSANFAFWAFSEVPRILGTLTCFVPWRTYTRLRQEYAALVAWRQLCHVKVQDSYLPSCYLKPGRCECGLTSFRSPKPKEAHLMRRILLLAATMTLALVLDSCTR
jgi:hypothetical protein